MNTWKAPDNLNYKWKPLEYKVQRQLKAIPLRGNTLLLGLSGGADSTALLLILKALAVPLGFQLRALYCHHGSSQNQAFRDQSEVFTRALCAFHEIPYEIYRNLDPSLQSEEQLRNFRRQSLRQAALEVTENTKNEVILVLGHHRDDLLETRLLRLIRGTGPQGLMAMQLYHDRVLRPFLDVSRDEIEEYLQGHSQEFMKDPWQEDLRSFIRYSWLVQLENRQPGGTAALGRSLELIAASGENLDFSSCFATGAIPLSEFLLFSVNQQTQVLAHYISSLGMRNYTRGLIQEIIKNLDKSQKVHTFHLAGLRWDIDAKNIRATVL